MAGIGVRCQLVATNKELSSFARPDSRGRLSPQNYSVRNLDERRSTLIAPPCFPLGVKRRSDKLLPSADSYGTAGRSGDSACSSPAGESRTGIRRLGKRDGGCGGKYTRAFGCALKHARRG